MALGVHAEHAHAQGGQHGREAHEVEVTASGRRSASSRISGPRPEATTPPSTRRDGPPGRVDHAHGRVQAFGVEEGRGGVAFAGLGPGLERHGFQLHVAGDVDEHRAGVLPEAAMARGSSWG